MKSLPYQLLASYFLMHDQHHTFPSSFFSYSSLFTEQKIFRINLQSRKYIEWNLLHTGRKNIDQNFQKPPQPNPPSPPFGFFIIFFWYFFPANKNMYNNIFLIAPCVKGGNCFQRGGRELFCCTVTALQAKCKYIYKRLS